MTKEAYERMARPFRARPGRIKALNTANKAITSAVYMAYPALIGFLAFSNDARLWNAFIGPALL